MISSASSCLFFLRRLAGAALIASAACVQTQARELVVVDGALPDYQLLTEAPGRETVVLSPGVDPVKAVGEVLSGGEPVAALHLISHGAPGRMIFAGGALDASTITRDGLASWRAHLADGAEIFVYGCEVAKTETGRNFLADLARATSARVAGSTGLTGGASPEADWTLEYTTDSLRGASLNFPEYRHTLATLAQGDLIVTGWNAFTDTVHFVALADIPAGTVIKITDRGWDANTAAFTSSTTGDGTITWTVSSAITAGSVFRLVLGGSDNAPANSLTNLTTSTDLTSSISVSTYTVMDPILISGDQIFFYQDADTNPFFISGFNNSAGALDASGWNTSVGTTLRDSMRPPSLTNGTNAMGVTPAQLDNVQYTGSVTAANRATWLSRLTNIANWTGDNTSPGLSTSTVGTSVSFPPPAPAITSALTASGTYNTSISTYTITGSNSPTSFSASGLPSGLSINTSNGQITGAPLATGTFNVTIGATNAGGTGTATLVFTIGKATATVTLGSLSQTYTGSARVATAATTPSGLTVNVTYDGSGTAPTNAGNYAVVGTISDANYQGSASGTLSVAKATATVSLGSLSQTYTGSARVATATTTPSGLTVNLTYDGSGTAPTNAGSYAVVGTISDTNYQGSASGTLSVAKATATVTLGSLSQTYTGSARVATATTTPSGLTVNVTYDGSGTAPTNAGSYAVVGTISDTNYQGSASGTLSVAKATATVTLGSLSQTYNGSARVATATTTPSGLTVEFTYDGSGTAPTNAGSYAVVGAVNDTNYQGSNSGVLNVAKAVLTVTADNKTRPYGYANPTLTATITGFVGGDTSAVLSGEPSLSTAAGVASVPAPYAITAALGTLGATNYTFSFADGTLTVRLLEIADWETENFSPAELLDPGVSGPAADPDLDGVTNLYEYAFGTDPNDIGSGLDALVYSGTFAGGGTLVEAGQPVARTETAPVNNTRLLFVRRAPSLVSDLNYVVQFSYNGSTWSTSAATPTVLAQSGVLQVVSVPYPSLTSGKRTRFHRVVVNLE